MSNQAITWALSTPTGGPATKVLLIALANYANEHNESYPSVARLSAETDMSESTVKRHLKALDEDLHLITRIARGGSADGGRQTNRYLLHMGVRGQIDPEGLGSNRPGVWGQNDRGMGSTVTPEPKNQKEPNNVRDGKPSPDDDPRPDVKALCDRLLAAVHGNGATRATITKAWYRECRLLLDRDGITADQVERAIDWATSHHFWKTNILSMPTLREKYDRLRIQAAAEQQAGTNGHRRPEPPPPAYVTPPAVPFDELPWVKAGAQ